MMSVLALALLAPSVASAEDSEGCLNCHQYRGLARLEEGGVHVTSFYVDPAYYSRGLGAHARLKCTDCHDRAAVSVFPHHDPNPVNCAQTCHLSSSSEVERLFSHKNLERHLNASAHTPEVLSKANALLGHPLKEGQARCLLCHDEPLFQLSDDWLIEDRAIERCDSCHNDNLPKDTRFAFRHVHARAQHAQSDLDVVRMCGGCHANEAVRESFDLPDSAASYLNSFHGKAALLGGQAANCLDCHKGPGRNIHHILSKTKLDSSTNEAHTAATCRSSGCHRDAGAQISSAAIHLNIAKTRGVEYIIAVIFLLMIVSTFGPSLMLTTLKLIHYIIDKHAPDHHRHERLAKKIVATSLGREKLIRFPVHQRLQHWLLAISFIVLCITGFPMKFADQAWSAWVVVHLGGLSAVRLIHRIAGVALLAGFVYHIIYVIILLVRAKKRDGKGWIRTFMEAPMGLSPDDAKGMLHLTLYLLFLRKEKPSFKHFNPEEKFEYLGVFWGTIIIGLTGLMMWANAWTTRYLPGNALTIAHLLHGFEAFLALLHVGVVHLVSVIFQPGVFPLSPAMFTGETPVEELAEGHGLMLEEVAAELGLSAEGADHE
ncbi:cytochrome b/b6 domain-containing protein [Myxococcota bacterium]|nr:cytochrome b/b6 domain-containing protein [Myxococcota bacterium]MBU1430139.1 cytochrome b/b6 domain-containing protein [Myxococcota bacterium]MBU1900650.1 cytochrome b/b6 domain-containing protein [Myxococcota bacterium]